ncbi:hypothetical protein KSW81_006160 [Nannochloris sp. 'desiccata']|nr:hypothetical protein KSW81_006160 [Chlorella desiccata (nom. nud.)]
MLLLLLLHPLPATAATHVPAAATAAALVLAAAAAPVPVAAVAFTPSAPTPQTHLIDPLHAARILMKIEIPPAAFQPGNPPTDEEGYHKIREICSGAPSPGWVPPPLTEFAAIFQAFGCSGLGFTACLHPDDMVCRVLDWVIYARQSYAFSQK